MAQARNRVTVITATLCVVMAAPERPEGKRVVGVRLSGVCSCHASPRELHRVPISGGQLDMASPKDLLENHLTFLNTHRGTVERSGGAILVDSTSPDFACAILENVARIADVPQRFAVLRLVPWSRLTDADLASTGFERKPALTYMTLVEDAPVLESTNAASIERVSSTASMDVFTEVQTRAFLEPGESFHEWFDWLRPKNQANLSREGQCFYLCSSGGAPIGVTLTVRTGTTLGIYGVATLPEHRKRGVSTALLRRAVADGRERGAETITLQVTTGSYAESLYRKRGFQPSFVSPKFFRGSDSSLR
jgi:GNAT superfamily N-acetyltransferase